MSDEIICYECVGRRYCIMCEGSGKDRDDFGIGQCRHCRGKGYCLVCKGEGVMRNYLRTEHGHER